MSTAVPGSRLLSAADGFTDLACFAFAAWTLLCHLTVFLGGSLRQLLAAATVAALLLGAALLLRPRLQGPELANATTPQGPPAPPLPLWVRVAGLAIGGGLAGALAVGIDPLRLWLPCALYLLVTAVASLRRPPEAAEPAPSRAAAVALWSMAVGAALLTAGLCRPDADDALYVSMAVTAADAPSSPLLASDPLHGVPGVRLDFPTYRLHALEPLAGAAAYLTGVDAIVWLHLVLPPFAALLGVLAMGRVARRVAPTRWPWVTAAVVVLLVGVGQPHGWHGNFAFVRLHQGKGILVTVVLTLLLAYGVELASSPGRRAWLRLAATATAAVGLNASALWLTPAVALPGVLAAIPLDRRAFRTAALAGLALGYPLLLAAGFSLALRSTSNPLRPYLLGLPVLPSLEIMRAQAEPPPAAITPPPASPRRLAHLVDRIFLDGRFAIPCAIVLLCGWWLSPETLARRLHLVFAALAATMLVNPHLVDWLAAHVVGPHTAWRLAWVVPLPLLLALALTAPAARWPGAGGTVGAALAVAGFVGLVGAYPVWSPANETSLRPFRLKVPVEREVAAALAGAVRPHAVVVAPGDVSPWVTTFHHHPHPLVVRNQYLQPLREHLGAGEVAARRDLTWLVSQPDPRPAQLDRLLRGLDRFEVEGICFPAAVPPGTPLANGLAELGFRRSVVVSGREVWSRDLGGISGARCPRDARANGPSQPPSRHRRRRAGRSHRGATPTRDRGRRWGREGGEDRRRLPRRRLRRGGRRGERGSAGREPPTTA